MQAGSNARIQLLSSWGADRSPRRCAATIGAALADALIDVDHVDLDSPQLDADRCASEPAPVIVVLANGDAAVPPRHCRFVAQLTRQRSAGRRRTLIVCPNSSSWKEADASWAVPNSDVKFVHDTGSIEDLIDECGIWAAFTAHGFSHVPPLINPTEHWLINEFDDIRRALLAVPDAGPHFHHELHVAITNALKPLRLLTQRLTVRNRNRGMLKELARKFDTILGVTRLDTDLDWWMSPAGHDYLREFDGRNVRRVVLVPDGIDPTRVQAMLKEQLSFGVEVRWCPMDLAPKDIRLALAIFDGCIAHLADMRNMTRTGSDVVEYEPSRIADLTEKFEALWDRSRPVWSALDYIVQDIAFAPSFISYSHTDDTIATRLHFELSVRRHLDCWKDDRDLVGGSGVRPTIHRTLQTRNGKVIVLCSQRSLASPWVAEEIEAVMGLEQDEARRLGTSVGMPGADMLIPVDLDGYLFSDVCESHLARLMRNRHVIRLRSTHDGDFRRLVDGLLNALAVRD